MKRTKLLSVFLFASFLSIAQSNTVASGGIASGTGGTATFTVGQIDYINSTGTNGNSNQGVQQPFEFFQGNAGIKESDLASVTLYPNPTSEFVLVEIETTLTDVNYLFYDMNGKLILSGKIENNETKLDMRSLSAGEYHLSILNLNTTIESIKIIKH